MKKEEKWKKDGNKYGARNYIVYLILGETRYGTKTKKPGVRFVW